jgi:molybdopterin-containing oxidoreductase family iron-sulfur binding subunit
VRERLANLRGERYWRSLEELAETPEFNRFLEREFPIQAPRDMKPLSRREFFRVMGAGLALAGVAGCSYQPAERIVPYVEQPERIIPGKPLYFATTFPREGYGVGVLAESNMGRPTKIEGNPDHPASLGATQVWEQASLLEMYDPDRSQAVRRNAVNTTWDTFLGEIIGLDGKLEAQRAKGGAGLRLVMGRTTSPTLIAQLQRLLRRFPQARICSYEPVGRENAAQGAQLALGVDAQPIYHFSQAKRVLSLDSDFLMDEPGSIVYAREWTDGRRVRPNEGRTEMNRLYAVQSTATLTGANADHRLSLPPSQIEQFALALAGALGAVDTGRPFATPAGVPANWIPALVKDLQANRGACLVVPGGQQSPAVHALALAMNDALGATGKTVTYIPPVEASFGPQAISLRDLVNEMNSGRVEMVLVLDRNPVYDAPADLDFAAALQKVALRIHTGLYDDETGILCQWHLPLSHYLEAWGDARAYDGTASIIQPLIQPLYASRSLVELLASLLGEGDRPGYDLVRETWRVQHPGPTFESFWNKALNDGRIANSAAGALPVTVRAGFAGALQPPPPASQLELRFVPDPHLRDGRWANNGWLQELPKPFTALTWDNAALVSEETAKRLRVANQQLIELTFRGRKLQVPVWIVPLGQPENTITLALGYGRKRAGRIGDDTGFNAYALRTTDAPWFGEVTVSGPVGFYSLASAQIHQTMEGRDLVRVRTASELPALAQRPEYERQNEGGGSLGHHPSMLPQDWSSDVRTPGRPNAGPPDNGVGEWVGKGYNDLPVPAWGMVIDLNTCIGCNTCTIACQAENNIPTVGKDQVKISRKMHWIRVDNYFTEDEQKPETVFQPVPCMHCEKAPCEPVCPVEATTHSPEGINEMTYNRCIGTRYCSNNCPYKVRRFNYLQYSKQLSPHFQMMANPDVTVRARGVMEKCTYCIQRINEARIQAEKESVEGKLRVIRDGDVVTACQQACPTQAIVFGNIADTTGKDGKGSLVRQLKLEPTNYGLLTELNTRPRTTYLSRIRNPNPELGGGA